MVQEEDGIECEIIDLRTLLPWDRDTVGAPLPPKHSALADQQSQNPGSCCHSKPAIL